MLARLSRLLEKTLADPEPRDAFKQGIDPASGEPEAFAGRMRYYANIYREILKEIELSSK